MTKINLKNRKLALIFYIFIALNYLLFLIVTDFKSTVFCLLACHFIPAGYCFEILFISAFKKQCEKNKATNRKTN